MARKITKGTELSVFRGREARLNGAILHILALESPQTIYEIYKQVKKQKRLDCLRYASVNKRAKALEELSYIKKAGFKKTKAGFNAPLYEISARGYLILTLRTIKLEEIIIKLDESQIITAIGLFTPE